MSDVDIHYDPITITNDPVSVHLDGLNDIQSTVAISLSDPLKSESQLVLDSKSTIQTSTDAKVVSENALQISVREPIKIDGTTQVDLQPVALDQCLNIRFGELPPTRVRQPFEQRIALTLFGIEWFGISLSGQWQTNINESERDHKPCGGSHRKHDSSSETTNSSHQGLRVRLQG